MKHNKRYLLFSFPDYYPSGGWGDLDGTYETLEELLRALKENKEKHGSSDNYEIIDLFTLEPVEPFPEIS